ncbi:dienelactone hydrolase family protein [Dokdonella sp.]|uniref:dienelactone hydrolase family protein n=1 Tax=Dokdonella sp. TaxID=2291710 RepID=UPI001B09E319|nr:dienelactone hydrolase family protein [Dokdonella sp.]MBO9663777.1 dienelactone hydrolase family protein [Dokdonella sp.]
MRTITFVLASLFALPLHAAVVSKPLDYEVGGKKMQSVLVYDDAVKTPRPGVVMTPDWLGITPDNLALAKQIAGKDYVILVADVYGADQRPKNADEAGAATKALYQNRDELRARIGAALAQLKAQAGKAPLDGRHYGAIGFCFGGATTLELARSGADVAGVVSFHGNLETDDPARAKNIKAKVLVLHGADDKYESPEQIAAFQQEMRDGKVDWQFLSYGGAVHCFAIPTADGSNRGCKYDERTARRAFAQMHAFFDEAFAAK